MSRKGISDALTLLDNKIPTKTSELENDSNFATTSDIPTKTSQLTNDSGFINSSALPTKTSDLTNDSGFITADVVPDNYQPAIFVENVSTVANNSLFTPTKKGWLVLSCKSHVDGAEAYVRVGNSSGTILFGTLGVGSGSMKYNNAPSGIIPVNTVTTYYVHTGSYYTAYYCYY